MIRDKVVLITGGSKGIGLGIAETLLSEGMKVAVTGRSTASLEQARDYLTSRYPEGHLLLLKADVCQKEQMEKVVHDIHQTWGTIHTVIANAGVGHFGSIEDLSDAQWHDTINTNLTGVYFTLKTCLEDLKATKGYLITIASLAGTNFFATASAYNASKFGLVGFTQAVMLDLRKYGIKVTTIMPGSVTSYFNGHTPGPEDDWKIQPEDIGQIVRDLLFMHPRTLPSKIEVRPTMPPK
jgi:3-oxoacyl-[acyl-carrier protein] reductase